MARQGVELCTGEVTSSQYKGRGFELERPLENKPNTLSHLLSLFALKTGPRPDILRICMYVKTNRHTLDDNIHGEII